MWGKPPLFLLFLTCALPQLGNVLVENLECTSAMYDSKSAAARSGKYCGTCDGSSWPL